MNLSKLTNPAEPEGSLGGLQHHPSPDNDLVSTGTQTDVGTLDSDSRTVSSTVAAAAATEATGDEVYAEDHEEYNGDEDNYGNDNDTELGVGSDKDDDSYTGQEARDSGSQKRRSTAEYRTLYQFLLDKYKSANHTSKVLDEFELYLKKLSKYQQLRNNTLVDTLKFIDKHESFESISDLSTSQLEEKLMSILRTNERMRPLVTKLIDLEKLETSDDSRANLNAFHNLIGINDSLSSDLAIQESNIFPDLYTNRYDFFELVKKNQRYENKVKSYIDLKDQIKSENSAESVQTEIEAQAPRKRAKTSASSSNGNGMVSRSEGTENSLKITIQRKRRKVAREPHA
ncbi:hypothetical protein PMKS-000232 [Pichia membranifaciens]|uniref:Uncharacterized protein n=1 Tax=Pichia membranifaciens TaxID=4926 RepID=A0A1Q2YB45_9ASCO|nr:hypothetical protein PMKS-000232 [Pichia membranifaciens]